MLIIIVKKIDNPNDECPICYDTFSNNDFFITKCGHKFCGSCIFKHYRGNNTTCPLCRQSFLNIDIPEFMQSRTPSWDEYMENFTDELSNIQNITNEDTIKNQINELNKLVINELVPKILSQIQQHYGYLRDSTKRIDPLSLPKNTNLFGRRITNSTTPF